MTMNVRSERRVRSRSVLGFGLWVLGVGAWGLGFGAWVLGFAVSAVGANQFQGLNWPAEGPPRPLAPRTMNFPPYEIRTLANGLKVIAVAQNEQPAVTMRLLIGAGAGQDPARKSGTARLVASLLDQGTASRSAEQIADQIDSIGGSMGTGSSTDLSNVFSVVMKDSFPIAMDLLHDVVRNPAFAPEEIDRQKQQAISSLQVNRGDPDYVASVLFDRLVYGFHPYGVTNTPESLGSITRSDLQAFHRQYFVPNNMILAIVGDVTSEEAFATAEKVFGRWPRAVVPPTALTDPPPPTRRIIVVDKPDSVQTEIRVGQLAIARKHPDYAAWDLTVKILGGEGANRLHRVLRSERGLTYGASADTQAMKQAGDFVAETDTRTETTVEALRLMVDEFSRLQRQRVGDRELADAQAYLAGSFPLTLETPNDLATQLLVAAFYELPVEEIRTYRERVQTITPDDIQRVARLYIRQDRLSIVLVGNAKAFVNQLRAQGYTDFEVIPIGDLDLTSATLTRDRASREAFESFGPFGSFGSFPRPAYTATQVNPNVPNAPNISNVPNDGAAAAVELLRRVVDARGGLAALKTVRTVVVDTMTTVHLAPATLPAAGRTYVSYPDRFRVDMTLPAGGEVVQTYNGGAAWEKSPAGIRDAPSAMRDEFAAGVRRDIVPLLIAAAEGRLLVRLLPDEPRPDGGRAQVLEISGPQIDPVRLFINDRMLIAGQVYSRPGPNGKAVRSEEAFSDYRLVSGLQVPFEARLFQSGRVVMTRTVTAVRFNEPVPDTLFAKPQ
jgi:zinc protease